MKSLRRIHAMLYIRHDYNKIQTLLTNKSAPSSVSTAVSKPSAVYAAAY
jgi:hypothetical protein